MVASECKSEVLCATSVRIRPASASLVPCSILNIARMALASREWNATRGISRDGDTYGFVASLLTALEFLQPLDCRLGQVEHFLVDRCIFIPWLRAEAVLNPD